MQVTNMDISLFTVKFRSLATFVHFSVPATVRSVMIVVPGMVVRSIYPSCSSMPYEEQITSRFPTLECGGPNGADPINWSGPYLGVVVSEIVCLMRSAGCRIA